MIKIINFLKKYTDGKQNTEKVEISVIQLNRVIKALEQELCEDCISRQAVLDEAEYLITLQETKMGFIGKRGYFVDIDDIKALPTGRHFSEIEEDAANGR